MICKHINLCEELCLYNPVPGTGLGTVPGTVECYDEMMFGHSLPQVEL